MSLRRATADLLRLDPGEFLAQLEGFRDRHDLDGGHLNRAVELDAFDGPSVLDGYSALDSHEQTLVWKSWVLDEIPLGITVSGPAYQDNPIVYANETFRELTGYSMTELHGENPRLLQGPETASEPVDDLREALDIWEPVTVEIRNYRRDGTPFRNRVSLVPTTDETGTVTNWVGIQEVIDI
jgi:PAS domain S-box-containing protein